MSETPEVWSFGMGSYGRLGHGDTTNQLSPTPLRALRGKPVAGVAAGTDHCLVCRDSLTPGVAPPPWGGWVGFWRMGGTSPPAGARVRQGFFKFGTWRVRPWWGGVGAV